MAILHSSDHAPCSLHSTGIVSSFGMKPRVSVRGDKICASVEKAERFFSDMRPRGVERVPHFYGESEKEGHCHLVTPHIYLDWLEKSASCDCRDERVEEVAKNRIVTSSGTTFEGKMIVLASGAYAKRGHAFFPQHPFIAGSSIVKGSYGFFEGVDLGESSFVFSRGKANLVYRRKQRQVVIGGTVDGGVGTRPDPEAVKNQYSLFSDFFPLPPFASIRMGAGLRHRGAKRMPFWGKMSDAVYGILGLYKNGWSLSSLAAEEVLREMGIGSKHSSRARIPSLSHEKWPSEWRF